MNGYALVVTIVPSAVLFVATICDIRTRRIPNRLTYTFAVLGCARRVLAARLPLPIDALVELFADVPVIASNPPARDLLSLSISLSLACSLLGAARATGPGKLGGGDAKLIFGLALWTGPIQLWRTIAITIVVTFGWFGIRTWIRAGREATDRHRTHGVGVPFAPFLLIGHLAATLLQLWGQK